MSKYEPLSAHLARATGRLELSFEEIERVLGFALPASARSYPAWWSNSGGTHVQAQSWMSAGFRTENVDLVRERVSFVPETVTGFSEMKQAEFDADQTAKPSAKPAPRGKGSGRHPVWGVWKGLVTLDPDYDYTQPADPEWGKVYKD
jgi:hypothetical protein